MSSTCRLCYHLYLILCDVNQVWGAPTVAWVQNTDQVGTWGLPWSPQRIEERTRAGFHAWLAFSVIPFVLFCCCCCLCCLIDCGAEDASLSLVCAKYNPTLSYTPAPGLLPITLAGSSFLAQIFLHNIPWILPASPGLLPGPFSGASFQRIALLLISVGALGQQLLPFPPKWATDLLQNVGTPQTDTAQSRVPNLWN